MGSSTESDLDDDSNYGPTTRRAWSDYCSTKGKSSNSDDDGCTGATVKVIIILLIIN